MDKAKKTVSKPAPAGEKTVQKVNYKIPSDLLNVVKQCLLKTPFNKLEDGIGLLNALNKLETIDNGN